jgi:hypothetical protein
VNYEAIHIHRFFSQSSTSRLFQNYLIEQCAANSDSLHFFYQEQALAG